jgi:hypothetical protein
MAQSNTGISRNQRLNTDLLDNLCQIDDKSVEDLLGYIQVYLEHINYFNLQNEADGTWSEIVAQDPLFYMVSILNFPIVGLKANTTSLQKLSDWYTRILQWRDKLNEMGEGQLADQISDLIGDPVFQSQATLVREAASQPVQEQQPEPPRPLFGYPYSLATEAPKSMPEPEDIIPDFLKIVLQIRKYTSDQLKHNICETSDHNPNIAIYIAFMELYKNLQDNINTLPQRHLDFYYKDVLLQSPLKGTPVSTYVYFQLLPTIPYSVLNKQSLISAGKLFGSQTDILFETANPVVLYPAEIANIQTLYFNRSPFVKTGTDQPMVSNIVLNPLVQAGQSLTGTVGTAVFGADPQTIFNPQINPETIGNMGFIIGSPVLYLSEGKRQVTLHFQLTDNTEDQLWELVEQIAQYKQQSVADTFVQIFESAFNLSCTTAAGWVTVDNYAVEPDQDGNSFTISLTLDKSFPAITPALPKITDGPDLPAIQFELNPNAAVYAYSFLENLTVLAVKIDVSVQEIKDLTVYNNLGMLSVDKPFALFGTMPVKDSYLLVGKAELFQKQVNSLSVQFDWQGIPTVYGGFDTYYAGYTQPFNNDSFQVQGSVLSNGYWVPTDLSQVSPVSLFQTEASTTPAGYDSVVLKSVSTIPVTAFNARIPADRQLQEPLIYSNNLQSGFFKLTLVSPDAGFGNQTYQQDYTSIAIYNAKHGTHVPYPNQPYIPIANSISLSYEASDLLEFSALSMKNSPSVSEPWEFMHLSPFGIKRNILQTATGAYLITDFKGAGYLYFELNGMPVNASASLYFHFVQSNPEAGQSSPVTWEYLFQDEWQPLDENLIIHDGTSGFTRSGIVELLLPSLSTEFQQALSNNYAFRVYAVKSAGIFPELGGIYPNAVKAICTSDDPDVIGKPIAAGSLSKMSGIYPDLKAVIQPVDSTGGKLAETEIYTRVSERLRHKNRALTAWDYERLVLENFSSVGIVKCTRRDQYFQEIPGQANLILIEKTWTVENPTYFSLDELVEIRDFLKQCSNPFTHIRVMNPIVESLLVNCVVEFIQEDAGGYYLELVNQEIIRFLSPVSKLDRTTGGTGGIGGVLTTGMLLGHLENLPYLKSVKSLNIEHICHAGTDSYSMIVYEVDEKIKAATPWSILVPMKQNRVRTTWTLSEAEIAELSGEKELGIGDLKVGLDFILGEEAFDPGKPPDLPHDHHHGPPNSILVFKRNAR